jgi:alpha-glucosidase
VNAEKKAQDYSRKTITIPNDGTIDLQMAPGGGFAIRIL